MAYTQDGNPFDPYNIQGTLVRRKTSGVPNPYAGTDTGIPRSYGGYEDEEPGSYPNRPGDINVGATTTGRPFLPGEDSGPGTGYPRGPSTPSPYAPQAMSGWDQNKWADPAVTTPKYVVGRILSNYPTTPQGIQQAMPAILKAFPNATFNGKDILTIPGMGSVDILVGATSTGGTGWAWQPTTDENGNPLPSDGSASWAGGDGGGGGAWGDDIRGRISQLINQHPTDMSTSPVYQGAIGAYDTQQQRNTERERNAIAERMAAEGTNTGGGFSDRMVGAEQTRGENTAQFAGNLAVRELERQRDEIMQALNIGAGLLTEDMRMALSEKLALLNASLQQQQITNQNNQFNQNMGWEQDMWEWLQNQSWYNGQG